MIQRLVERRKTTHKTCSRVQMTKVRTPEVVIESYECDDCCDLRLASERRRSAHGVMRSRSQTENISPFFEALCCARRRRRRRSVVNETKEKRLALSKSRLRIFGERSLDYGTYTIQQSQSLSRAPSPIRSPSLAFIARVHALTMRST
ncbi:hypothetical protein RB195_021584 [Necator americanus]